MGEEEATQECLQPLGLIHWMSTSHRSGRPFQPNKELPGGFLEEAASEEHLGGWSMWRWVLGEGLRGGHTGAR
jgi:hypothetical protein